ncbi:membrane protein insertase YidC [Halovulum dunhuangense]|uniref:Membrane protein insertase YidC n=1 Tax=Halovulum dunhuangense TaxID=1505036 RepID=A0A849L0Q6_9RHOB|nr:membrane protein insertase YidC [Halovulum dunhuangense]NNU79819.1 membrane protein insertase YidC [Halovulum dunhuangense]
MDDQNKNLILATALSFLVILVWFILFPPPPPQDQAIDQAEVAEGVLPPTAPTGQATAPGLTAPEQSRAAAIAAAPRVSIDSPRLTGSLSLTGGRIDDLLLDDYRETVEPDSENVTLLSPAGSPNAYYALHGWVGGGGLPAEQVPGPNTPWQLESGETLTPGNPVTLVWENGAGLVFRKTIAVDDNYLFTITQSVENATEAAVRLAPYGIIAREGEPSDLMNFFILHEGVIQSSDGTLNEVGYDDVRDFEFAANEAAATERTDVAGNGWIGFTDHYWMTTLIPQSGQSFTAVAKHNPTSDIFQTDIRLPTVEVAPGTTGESTTYFFAGAKEYRAIADYEETLGINQFVDAIDWGWFYFLTKPIFQALHWFNVLIGNMGIAIIGLTLVIKALLLPLAYKSYVSMSKMKQLQPEMEKIKERAGDDRMKLQQEMMALYKKEKVNPASGCLPILLQIPIFFSLYKVIFVTIELRHAPFFGWIRDLSAPDPSSVLNLFGLLPWGTPGPESFFAIFSIGVLPILMGITMWMQQKLNPAPTDKTQAMVFAWMPWIFMFMLGTFASGLVLYWTANNIITFVQQYLIMRSQGVKPDVFGNILGGLKRAKSKAK